MMIQNENGTFTGGPLDVLCILNDVTTGRYHAAFFEEKPFPGPVESVKNTDLVRLKSKMHHTEGSDTIEGALEHLVDLSEKLIVPSDNIWKDPIEWDGELDMVLLVPNWRKE